MTFKKQIINVWAVLTILALLGLVGIGFHAEWVQDLGKQAAFKYYFVELAPWSYVILGNALGFIIFIQRN
jgi:hypothetical protein